MAIAVRVLIEVVLVVFIGGIESRERLYLHHERHGVALYLRSGEFIHSKTIVADDYLCCIGSTNLDNRSFGIDFELNAFFYDKGVAEEQKALFAADLPRCRRVTAEEPRPTPWQRFMRHLAPIV